MSEGSFTKVTHESWFSRIRGAFKGILIGLVLFLLAFPLLFWNEGRAVARRKTLEEGGGAVLSVSASSVDAANAGKLIHVTGKADTRATLTDPIFGVSANALKLNRVVEMYQWEESSESKTDKKVGGGTTTTTTYSYSKTWSDRAIDSTGFNEPTGHQNPGSLPYESTEQIANGVTLGAFVLSPSLLGRIQSYESYPVESSLPLPTQLIGRAQIHDAGFYIGTNPGSPQIGDTRVKFLVVRPTEISVIAAQVNDTFAPYAATTGGTIELLQTGIHTAGGMIERAQQSNKMMTWILRVVGFMLMVLGLNMILKPLSVVADILPILGRIVGAGTGIIAFLLGAMLSLGTIGIAWIFYRPLLGIFLLVVAVGLTVAIAAKLRGGRQPSAA
jgi:hypothetical protein